jgi:ATP-dependent exoDNAse (exonuclease V) alpha subunit
MNELLSASARAKAKVVLVGDSQQLQPISASPALKILMSVIEPNRIDKIIRQREQWARDAARSFAEGDAAGLASYADRGLLQSCAGAKVIVTRAVDQYLAANRSAPQQEHLLIAKSNKVVRALNAEIRRRMRADNVLVGPDYTIKTGDSSGRAFGLNLAVGDRIRFELR